MNVLSVSWQQEDGVLLVGNQSVVDLYDRHGDRPLYIYDLCKITERIEQLKRAMNGHAKLHYAIKANPNTEVVAHIASLVDGLDVASAGELNILMNLQVSSNDISFAGPGKTDDELRRAVSAGVVLNVESENELHRLAVVGNDLGSTPKAAIRVNPDFELKSSGMKMSGGAKPFGIDAERVAAAILELVAIGLEFHGLHIFCGSQNLLAPAICEAQSKAMSLAILLCEEAQVEPRFVNIGGGLGIPYFPGEVPLDLDPIGANLESVQEMLLHCYSDAQVVIELGRYLVGEAGIYVCRVVDRKVSRGVTYLVTNGGLHHNLSLSGNFGQVIRKNYPVVIGNRMATEAVEIVHIVGPLCTPLDVLGDKLRLPRANIDDLVVVKQSGAYGYSASPHLFLSHPPPLEIVV